MKLKLVFIIAVLLLGLLTAYGFNMQEGMTDSSKQEGKMEGSKRLFTSNGERIYITGVSERTGRIPFQKGPMWLRMHGGSCANCHGATGKGGVPVMMGTAIPSDIRYKTLTVKEHHHEEEKEEEHPPYTDELIRRAITRGLNPAGEPFDLTMPRFIMTKEDLDDVIEYLKTLK